MSQMRSESMKLYCLSIKNDQHWNTANELLKLDFLEYHNLNKSKSVG
jgi:hypothetical protein